VIPVFNRPVQIVRALESVAAQTLAPREVVVVDDGSSDGTADAAEAWAMRRTPLPFAFQVIRQANRGAAAARNAGFAALRDCSRVLFLDSDDRLAPDLLERANAALDGCPGAVLALADISQVTAEDRPVKRLPAAEIAAHPLRFMFALGSAFLSSSLIDADAARRAGLFPAGYPTGQDTVFLCRLALQGKWLALPGAPCLMATYLAQGGGEAGHLSSRYPDRFKRWARMHGAIFREVAPHVGRDDRIALRRSISGRYFNAAQYAWRGGRYGDILPHLPRAAWHMLAAYAERLRP
jgi:glycosyltransferase involved in cell wall biosynthesis